MHPALLTAVTGNSHAVARRIYRSVVVYLVNSTDQLRILRSWSEFDFTALENIRSVVIFVGDQSQFIS